MTVAKKQTAEVLPPSQTPALRAHAGIAAVIPQTLAEALTLAKLVCDAGLAPDSYNDRAGNPDQQKIAIGILKSLEVGLPPITGLSTIAIINKRPCIWGDGAVALVQSRGVVEKIEEVWEGIEKASGPVSDDRGEKDYTPKLTDFPDEYTAVYRIWRKGQETPYEGRFSVRDARRAHLWGNTKKVPWIEHPKRMLKARARAFALRDGFSDCLHGLSIREEVEDLPAEAPEQADVSFLSDDPPAQIAAPTDQPIGEVQVSPGASAPEPASTTHGESPSAAAGDVGAPAPQDETPSAPGEPANGDDSAIPAPTVLEIEPDADEQAVLAWCKVAAEILSVAPSPKWIDGWLAANATTLNRIKTAGPKGVRFYKRLVDRASERVSELRAAA